jgi:hypothetical protein
MTLNRRRAYALELLVREGRTDYSQGWRDPEHWLSRERCDDLLRAGVILLHFNKYLYNVSTNASHCTFSCSCTSSKKEEAVRCKHAHLIAADIRTLADRHPIRSPVKPRSRRSHAFAMAVERASSPRFAFVTGTEVIQDRPVGLEDNFPVRQRGNIGRHTQSDRRSRARRYCRSCHGGRAKPPLCRDSRCFHRKCTRTGRNELP